jgi:outer membrane protein TolC
MRHLSPRTSARALGVVAAVCATLFAAPATLRAQSSAQPVAAAPGRPLPLSEALRIAEERSEGVRIARAGVLRARGQQYQARSQYLPQFNGSVSFVKTLQSQFDALSKLGGGGPDTSSSSLANSPIAQIFAARQTLTLGIAGQWNLFAGGRLIAANRIASAARRSAEIGLASSIASLQLQVTEAYYDAALADQLSTIADSSLAQSERTLSQVTLAKNVGNTSEFELLRAQVTRDNQRPAVIQRRAQRDIALLRLKQLLDIPADDSIQLVSALTDTTDSFVSAASDVRATDGAAADTASEGRAQVRQVAEAMAVQQNQFRIARAQRLPSLALSTAYGRISYPTSGLPQWNAFYPNWTVTATLSVPLFTGGRITGDEMVARANLTEARENYQQTKELAALDSRSAIADLEQALAAWRASSGTSEQASRAYRIAEVRYREGISTQLELSESRLLLEQAAANRASAARNLKVARVRLALIRDLPLGTVQGGASAGANAGAGAAGAGAGAQGGQTQQTSPQSQSASAAANTNSFGGQ